MTLAVFGYTLFALILSFTRIRTSLILCLNMFVIMVLAGFNYYEVVWLGSVKHLVVCRSFIPVDYYLGLTMDHFSLDLYLDFYSSQMLWLVTFVSFTVHVYSLTYMKDDPRLNLFMIYLTVFTFFMLIYVVSLSYLQLFLGWEGIGISSYLLVNFWHTRPQANKSSLKAVIVNRVGDYFFLFGFLWLIVENHSWSVVEPVHISIVPSLFLVLGAMAKSAQLGLHTWLADAMEGPTPVSALIHAATMVTAGVYLLVRIHPTGMESFLLLVGTITVVGSGLVALVQTDLKRIIAYSTCAQLGYMVVGIGLASPILGFYHLVNHAYFKALLFLSAGLVIHSLNDEQDIRRMGGLYLQSPVVYLAFVVSSLSLGGFPFLSGYYSKDSIIESVYTQNEFFSYFGLVFGAYLTVLYSMRLLHLVFWGEPKGSRSVYSQIHPVDRISLGVVILLFVFTVVHGYLAREVFIGFGSTRDWFCFQPENEFYLPLWVKLVPLSTGLIALGFNFVTGEINPGWYRLISKRGGIDLLDSHLTRLFLTWCYKSYHLIERGVLELFGSIGLAKWSHMWYTRVTFTGWFSVFYILIGLAFFVLGLETVCFEFLPIFIFYNATLR